jgi:hypothetical protein
LWPEEKRIKMDRKNNTTTITVDEDVFTVKLLDGMWNVFKNGSFYGKFFKYINAIDFVNSLR